KDRRVLRAVAEAQHNLAYILWTQVAPKTLELMMELAQNAQNLQHLTQMFDTIIKTAQLLTGQPTDHTQVSGNTATVVVGDSRFEKLADSMQKSLEALQRANEVFQDPREEVESEDAERSSRDGEDNRE